MMNAADMTASACGHPFAHPCPEEGIGSRAHDLSLVEGTITPEAWAAEEAKLRPGQLLFEVAARLRQITADESLVEAAGAAYILIPRP